ncbi:SGNH/GDSL hydrolase family protein [Candidatus Symbiothrix dinenymphae]|uniref:SGNH/GDSL hydrolase family protein n=1 Tax=Candidatus Symbiothrix dinenymphae TaxID=467085 RepID=UPI00070327EE|nr:SGNH/GDSL hydrolase family protein [Candidatus Symbiothrix dinenymphae]
MDRRNFFKKSVLAGVAVSIPEIVKAAMPDAPAVDNADWYQLSKGDTILFQGDSITDWGRDRKKEAEVNAPAQLGGGYPLFTAANILANNAEKGLKIYNRGISGNKVFQLAGRWDKDCIELKPNLLSILIGVNDFWHSLGQYTGTVETYETDYRALLTRTKKALPEVKIVICEPFIVHGGSVLDNTWESGFAPYRNVARKLAREFDLTFVPFQTVFNEALKQANSEYWGTDGVHPSLAGAQLMAQAWIKAVLNFH